MTIMDAPLPIDLTWAEPALRRRLLVDPRAVLSDEGIDLPDYLPETVVHEIVRLNFLLWDDGRVVARSDFRIDPSDEGLLFGKGVWESTRTMGGDPWLWPFHLDRLIRTAELLDITLDPERLPDATRVREFVRGLTTMDVIVRLNVTAGRPGQRGQVWMTAALPPKPMAAVRLRTARLPYEKGHPYLTWKTFQYASRLRLGRQVDREHFDSVLLIDEDGSLLEAAHANIFVRFDDGWATPAANGGLLPGTTRRRLLETSPWPVRERTIHRRELADAREVFLTNSNVGAVPVTRIDDRVLRVGAETLAIARWLGGTPVDYATPDQP